MRDSTFWVFVIPVLNVLSRVLAVCQKSRGILCYAKLSPPFRAISLAKNFNLWYTVKRT